MTDKKLIDWLLREDVLNLKEGLRPESVEEADTLPDDLTFSSAEPVADEPPTNSIAAAQRHKKADGAASKLPIVLVAIVIVLAAAGGAVYWLLGQEKAPSTDAGLPAEPTANVAGAADLATAATANTSVSDSNVASAALDATAVAAATSPTTAPTTLTAPVMAVAATTATTVAKTPAAQVDSAPNTQTTADSTIVAPVSQQYLVVAGPLKSSKIPAAVNAHGYAVELTYATTRQSGREVVALQPVADDIAAKAEAALAEKGYKVKIEVSEAGKLLRVGPFIEAKQADDAAVVLVLNQIPAKAQDIQIAIKTPYLNAGPFADEYAADQARAWLAENLGVATWRIEKP